MMLSEFVERTGFEPTADEFDQIESAYFSFEGGKDAFCQAFVQADGEKKVYQARAAEIDRLRSEITELGKENNAAASRYEAQIAALKSRLDEELEWKPYEFPQNVSQADYNRLAECVAQGGAHFMEMDEALDWICNEFGFDRSKVTILCEIDGQEINRHRHCRASKEKIARRPIYCATDYHYIRFNVGRGEWQWEAWGGQIRPFYD